MPLKVTLDADAFNSKADYFTGVTSLGDLLENEGYDQSFYCGSDANFGARKLFFRAHGSFQNFKDYIYYNSLPKTDPNYTEYDGWWGYEDYRLFEFMKQDLVEKSQNYVNNDVPFNVTGLTVDTHFNNSGGTDGHICPLCKNNETFTYKYGNVYNCEANQTYDFIDWFYNGDEIDDKTKENTTNGSRKRCQRISR